MIPDIRNIVPQARSPYITDTFCLGWGVQAMTASPWPGDLLDIMDWSSAEEEDIDQADRDVVTPAIYSHVFLPECGHFYANTFAGLCIDINSGAAARDQDQGRFCAMQYFRSIQNLTSLKSLGLQNLLTFGYILGTYCYLSLPLGTFPFSYIWLPFLFFPFFTIFPFAD